MTNAPDAVHESPPPPASKLRSSGPASRSPIDASGLVWSDRVDAMPPKTHAFGVDQVRGAAVGGWGSRTESGVRTGLTGCGEHQLKKTAAGDEVSDA